MSQFWGLIFGNARQKEPYNIQYTYTSPIVPQGAHFYIRRGNCLNFSAFFFGNACQKQPYSIQHTYISPIVPQGAHFYVRRGNCAKN